MGFRILRPLFPLGSGYLSARRLPWRGTLPRSTGCSIVIIASIGEISTPKKSWPTTVTWKKAAGS